MLLPPHAERPTYQVSLPPPHTHKPLETCLIFIFPAENFPLLPPPRPILSWSSKVCRDVYAPLETIRQDLGSSPAGLICIRTNNYLKTGTLLGQGFNAGEFSSREVLL